VNKLLLNLISGVELTGDVQTDALRLLSINGNKELVEHSIKVANEAKKIARRFGVSEEKAFIAGLLHDIGRIIPLNKSVDTCNELEIQVFEEEKLVPSLLHSKLSKFIASDLFQVDEDICNAIECHSTLKAYVSKLDLILFIADKVSWDRIDNEGFIEAMLEGLDVSLECSAIKFIEYLFSGHAEILHPWAIESYGYLKDICK
jgi:predicted HD superfamily hydrolase involved in NAD metabolism